MGAPIPQNKGGKVLGKLRLQDKDDPRVKLNIASCLVQPERYQSVRDGRDKERLDDAGPAPAEMGPRGLELRLEPTQSDARFGKRLPCIGKHLCGKLGHACFLRRPLHGLLELVKGEWNRIVQALKQPKPGLKPLPLRPKRRLGRTKRARLEE